MREEEKVAMSSDSGRNNDNQANDMDMPTVEQLKAELANENYKSDFLRIFRNSLYVLTVVASIAVLIAMLWIPVIQIKGASMSDTLQDKDIVIAYNTKKCQTGDIIAFYYNNNILVKRVIASTGQWVDMDKEGNVYVDGVCLEEPYVTEKAIGDCNITLPYQVPDGRYFVMGDHRATSVDSRNTTIGCVADEVVIGKIIGRVWPFSAMCKF